MHTLRKLSWLESKLFLREPLTVIFALAFPVLVVVVLGSVFGNTPEADAPFRGVGAMDYYLPGYVGLVLASLGLIALPVRLASYRERGVLRRFRASGVPTWAVLGSQVVVMLGIAVAGSLLLVVVGFIGFDVRAPDSLGGVLIAFVLSAVSFAAIGFLIGALMPSARAAQGLGLILFFVMMFLAGTDGPRELMGEALRKAGDVLPLTHVVTALQDPWVGFGSNLAELALIAGITVLAALLSLRLFRWE
jgi:ABC-2 type transport system permease protein